MPIKPIRRGIWKKPGGNSKTFFKQYPNTDFSDNAQFWIGETYYAKKDYEKAILEYEKVMAKYPEGDKVPAACSSRPLPFSNWGTERMARNLLGG